MSYTTSEAALVTLIAANLTGYSTSNTKAGDDSAAFKYANLNGGNVCVLDYGGGGRDQQPSRMGNDDLWIWQCVVTFYLAYDASTIETAIRSCVDNLLTLHRDNKRLSTGDVWRVDAARAYEVVKRGDRTFVPCTFLVSFKSVI